LPKKPNSSNLQLFPKDNTKSQGVLNWARKDIFLINFAFVLLKKWKLAENYANRSRKGNPMGEGPD